MQTWSGGIHPFLVPQLLPGAKRQTVPRVSGYPCGLLALHCVGIPQIPAIDTSQYVCCPLPQNRTGAEAKYLPQLPTLKSAMFLPHWLFPCGLIVLQLRELFI